MSVSPLQKLSRLMELPENHLCCDCKKKQAMWASSNLGIFICLDCSGIHRSMGTHISFVRSCTLDTWNDDQVSLMEKVGNKVANQYWEAKLTDDEKMAESKQLYSMTEFIRLKYVSKKWADNGSPPHQVEEVNTKQLQSIQLKDKSGNNSLIKTANSKKSCSTLPLRLQLKLQSKNAPQESEETIKTSTRRKHHHRSHA